MKNIELSDGSVCIVDDSDFNLVSRWRWKPIHSKTSVYAGRTIRGSNGSRWETVLMHRLLMDAPRGMQVDHLNRNTLDNRRENLRLCTQSQNNMNSIGSKKRKHSQYKGVTIWSSRGFTYWQARVKMDKRQHSLGYFKTEEEAARAYDAAAKEHFGEFARLNFPDD